MSQLSLIDQIERDALDSTVPIPDALRKVIALGGKVGSAELREWASRELHGYVGSGEEVPGYRIVSAMINIDGVVPGYQTKNQQISPRSFPEGIRDVISEEVPLTGGIGEVKAMLRQARADGAIRLSLPDAQTLARLLEHEAGVPFQHITAIYWVVTVPALEGVIDRVRTTLVELVAEMRAGTPTNTALPTAEVANQAVNVAVYGDKTRLSVITTQTAGSGPHTVTVAPQSDGRSMIWKLGAILVGAATVAGALFALAQWQGWSI